MNGHSFRLNALAFPIGISIFCLQGCSSLNPEEGSPAKSPAQYKPPGTEKYQDELASRSNVLGKGLRESGALDPDKAYSLADLVDLAERIHPETRIAWEDARRAAIAVGLKESEYYPLLILSARGGYDSLNLNVNSAGGIDPNVDASLGGAGLHLEWLLFDFGAREADINASKHTRMAAVMAFNAAHQKIIFEVQRAYYALWAERGRLNVAKINLESTQTVQDASSERLTNGLATSPDVLLARERTAQARYDLVKAEADEELAYADLCDAIGLPPTTKLKLADMNTGTLPPHLEETVEAATERALRDRPDLIAGLARVRAQDAEIQKARAELLPKISAQAGAERIYANATVNPVPIRDTNLTIDNYAAFIKMQWALFDGFANVNKIKLAKAEKERTEAELENSQVKVAGQVFQAYTKLKTSFRKLEVSKALVDASQKSYEASIDSYKQGLRTVLDTLASQRDYRAALETDVSARAEVYTNWQALAYATGQSFSSADKAVIAKSDKKP